jgi:hypothetical protein
VGGRDTEDGVDVVELHPGKVLCLVLGGHGLGQVVKHIGEHDKRTGANEGRSNTSNDLGDTIALLQVLDPSGPARDKVGVLSAVVVQAVDSKSHFSLINKIISEKQIYELDIRE